MKILKVILFSVLFMLITYIHTTGTELYVSKKNGSNGNPGTKSEPLKNLDKALKKASSGDIIKVAEGNYFGLRNKGYLEAPVPVKIYGGYSTDFSKRDILNYKTMIMPDNKSAAKSRKALLTFKKSKKGDLIVVDGLIFDMGERNSYSTTKGKPEGCETGMLLLPPKVNSGENVTVTEQCIYFPSTASSGDVIIRNCMFLNSAKFALQGGHKDGNFKILNNVFVANRMGAIELFGTGGRKGPRGPISKGGDVEIGNNTILFTWSRMKDLKDMGYGIRVMTKLSYDIHDNIIGFSTLTGVDNTRFNRDEWLKLDRNLFILNKQGDMMYSEAGQGTLERVSVSDFPDFDFASVSGNMSGFKKSFPVDKSYLQGFLSVRYSEKTDFNPNSPANELRDIFGLPKQGKMNSKVSMYMNRYPLKKGLKLFGAIKGVGAKLPDNSKQL